ncbi:MAG: hypothetical protein E6G72_13750 [Alphaproteobacteria bacterium]|nr:MAG: hypothetical protein E6G72_13750 [Alphaproteobacteria bacterium]
MLHDISEQVQLADDLGYDSVSFTEHHFHIEGFEVSNNPVLLDLYLPARSKSCAAGRRSNGCFATPNNSLVPHDVLMKTIERFWTEVMPRVA